MYKYFQYKTFMCGYFLTIQVILPYLLGITHKFLKNLK